MSYYVRPDFNLKTLNPYDIYQAIEQCNSKILKITYCSLRIDGQCMNTKTNVIQIKRLYKTCDFIEGTVLKDDKPYEDIVLKADQILKVECIKSNKPDNGKCVNRTSFPFLVTEIDRKNNNIKGYKVREGLTPEYIVLDASLILNVECVTQANSPNFPWGLIHFLMMQMKND